MAVQARGLLRVYMNFFAYRSASHNRKEFAFNRKSRFIAKLLAENAAEKKQWRKGFLTHKVYGSTSLSPKRLETLNRSFLANITDGLTTSTRCGELADLGLMVTRAELSSCGQSVRVMWSSCSSEADEQVAKILEECYAEVRENIVTKSVGGFVPHIIFTKDVEGTCIRDVQHILGLPSVVRDLQTELPREETDKDGENNEDRFKIEIGTNILGLRREDVLRRVMATVKRVRRAERRQKEEGNRTEGEIEVSEEIPDRLASIDAKKQKSAIAAFIKKQKLAEKKSLINCVEEKILQKEYDEDYGAGYSVEHELCEEYEEENFYDVTDLEDNDMTDTEENYSRTWNKSDLETALGDVEKPKTLEKT